MKNKIAILIENRFLDHEIIYYSKRFEEEGFETLFLTRLWGQKQLVFKGLELGMTFTADKSFEDVDSFDEYAAIIVPSGYVADMLRYSEKPGDLSPAVKFMSKVMQDTTVLKAVICHSLWIFDHTPEVIKNRKVTCHNNIYGSVKNTGAEYVDEDIVIDGDLISARTGDMYARLAKTVINEIKKNRV